MVEQCGLGGSRVVKSQTDALSEAGECFGAGNAFHLRKVGSRVGVPWFQKPVDDGAVIGEEQEPFAVGIQPTDRVHILRKCPAGCQRGVIARRGELTHDAVRFVQEDVVQAGGHGAQGTHHAGK